MAKQWMQHIAGLRGLAIVLVVLFHLMPQWCPCGHFGVDVFFVVSGYFMFSSVWKPGFTLREYYGKKVVRILPPLVALVPGTAAGMAAEHGKAPAGAAVQGGAPTLQGPAPQACKITQHAPRAEFSK